MDIIFDRILALLGKVIRHCKSTRTQTIVDILVASAAILIAICSAIGNYRKGNVLEAAIFASVVVISILIISFVVLRCILRKKKEEKEI